MESSNSDSSYIDNGDSNIEQKWSRTKLPTKSESGARSKIRRTKSQLIVHRGDERQKCKRKKISNSRDSVNSSEIIAEKGDLTQLIESIDFQSISTAPISKTWKERSRIDEEDWKETRNKLTESYVSQQQLTRTYCDGCHSQNCHDIAVQCRTCKMQFCWKCDDNHHGRHPFHSRVMMSKKEMVFLEPNMFFDDQWEKIKKDVCVPCFVPYKCKKCDSVGRQQLVPGSKSIIVVTLGGSVFQPTKCQFFLQ